MSIRRLTQFEQVEIPAHDFLELQDAEYLVQLRQELRQEAARCTLQADVITEILVEWDFEQKPKRQRRLGAVALHSVDGDA